MVSGNNKLASDPLVSVIMPAYNSGRYIAEAIRSVQAQTYPDWELVVADDGSTDDTAQVARTFDDARIHYLFQANAGQASARNAAIRLSSGPILAFLDSDDLWTPNKLELQLKTLSETKADLVYSNGYIFKDDDVTDESLLFSQLQQLYLGTFRGQEAFKWLFISNPIPMPTVVLRRAALERAGGFDERVPRGIEDYDLWLRLARGGATFFGMGEPLARYRVQPQGTSQQKANMLVGELEVMEKYPHAPEVEESVRRTRLRALYKRTITALIEEGRVPEARKYLWRQTRRHPKAVMPLAEALLIGTMPRRHEAVYSLLQRVEESANYRVGEPIRRARKLISMRG